MTTIDIAKLARLEMDLQQMQLTARGLTDEYTTEVERHNLLRHDLWRTCRNKPADWEPSRGDVADLLKRPAHEIERMGFDAATAHSAVACRERAAELKRRVDALNAQIAPLAQLVQRCRAFAAEMGVL